MNTDQVAVGFRGDSKGGLGEVFRDGMSPLLVCNSRPFQQAAAAASAPLAAGVRHASTDALSVLGLTT